MALPRGAGPPYRKRCGLYRKTIGFVPEGAGRAGEAAAEPSGAGAGPGAAGAGPGAAGPGPSGAGRDPPGSPGASEAAMPSKKKKYNARFPPARIKKIMQTDEEIGKVAAAVPVIISRALELFLESLLRKACHVTQSRNAKTMTTSHLKQCIELEQQFDFLKDLVAAVPDMQGDGDDPHGDGERGPRRGRRPGSGRKNGGPGAKGTPKQSGTDSEQEEESEDSDSDGDEETPQPPPAPPPLTFTSPGVPFAPLGPPNLPGGLSGGLPPAPGPPRAREEEEEDEDYDS